MHTTGTCLCQAVKVSAELTKDTFSACHCSMCRKWGGGPALCVDGLKNIQYEGEEFIAVYDSSPWAQRSFCKRCGTHLAYQLKDGSYINFPLGFFKGTEDFRFDLQVFIDNKPANYDFSNKTKTMTEAQVLAQFAPEVSK